LKGNQKLVMVLTLSSPLGLLLGMLLLQTVDFGI
jgi:hypothetical protein